MAFSESLASLEPWTFSTISDLWSNELFTRETETLTKALQISLSPDSELAVGNADETSSSQYRFNAPEPAPPASSVSDPETSSKRQLPILDRKISKRKSRVSKRSSTTFIAADPANFREMVQQVTGNRLGGSYVPIKPVLKAEARGPCDWLLQNCRLPTLDTSAPLLDQNKGQTSTNSKCQPQQQMRDVMPAMPERNVSFARVTGSAGFDFEKLHSFPTLESWGAM